MLIDLAITPISETLRRLGAERRSGDLLVSSGPAARMLSLDDGRVVFACTNVRHERFGEALVALGTITPDQYDHVSGLITRSPLLRFGDGLVEAGFVPKDAVNDLVARWVAKIAVSLFSLQTGAAAFEERRCSIPDGYRVDLSVPPLLLEGIKTMSDPRLIEAGVGDLDRCVRLASDPPFRFSVGTFSPEERVVLAGLHGAQAPVTLRRLACPSSSGLSVPLLRAAYAMLAGGVLEDAPGAAARPTAASEPAEPPTAAPVPVSGADVSPRGEESSLEIERLLTQANVSLMVSDVPRAVQTYVRLVELAPTVAAYRAQLAVLMARIPQTARQAEKQFVEALRMDPDNADLHFQFGLYYRAMKVPSRAIAEFRTVTRLDPGHEGARAQLQAASATDLLLAGFRSVLRSTRGD